jgi:hypothetical protein
MWGRLCSVCERGYDVLWSVVAGGRGAGLGCGGHTGGMLRGDVCWLGAEEHGRGEP